MKGNKGLGNIVLIAIGIVVLAIAVGAVAFPVAQTVFNGSSTSNTVLNATSTPNMDRTVATYMPTFVLLTLLVGIVSFAIIGVLKNQ